MQGNKRKTSKNSKQQWIILGITVIVLIVAIVLTLTIGTRDDSSDEVVQEEVTTVNDSTNIIREATYEGLTINNIVLTISGSYSTFTATVTNNSDETKNVEDFDIVFKKGDTQVVNVYAYLGAELAPGESRDITASIGMQLTSDVVDTAEYVAHE